jgi:hypothetical protein
LNENEGIYFLSRRGFHLSSRFGHCAKGAEPATFAFPHRGFFDCSEFPVVLRLPRHLAPNRLERDFHENVLCTGAGATG